MTHEWICCSLQESTTPPTPRFSRSHLKSFAAPFVVIKLHQTITSLWDEYQLDRSKRHLTEAEIWEFWNAVFINSWRRRPVLIQSDRSRVLAVVCGPFPAAVCHDTRVNHKWTSIRTNEMTGNRSCLQSWPSPWRSDLERMPWNGDADRDRWRCRQWDRKSVTSPRNNRVMITL